MQALDHLGKRVKRVLPVPRRKARRRAWAMFGVGAAAGVLAEFFADPARGKARRHQLVGRVGGLSRRMGRRVARRGRYMSSTASGWRRRVRSEHGNPPESDAVLAHKVQSEVFRSAEMPKEHINVNAEHGIVVLRGQVENPQQIKRIEKLVRRVDGVVDVENMLHLPGTPAPART